MDRKEINYMYIRVHQLRRWQIANHLKDEETLYFGQLPIIEYVKRHPGCSQKEISDRFATSRASVTKSVKRMIKSEVLTREVNQEDVRQFRLYVTQKGLTLSQKCRDVFNEVDNKVYEGFSEEEVALFGTFLEKMMANLETDYSRGKSARLLKMEADEIEGE